MFEGDRRTSRSFSGDAGSPANIQGGGVSETTEYTERDARGEQSVDERAAHRRRRRACCEAGGGGILRQAYNAATGRRRRRRAPEDILAGRRKGGRLGGKRGVGHGDEVGVVGGTWKRSEAPGTV